MRRAGRCLTHTEQPCTHKTAATHVAPHTHTPTQTHTHTHHLMRAASRILLMEGRSFRERERAAPSPAPTSPSVRCTQTCRCWLPSRARQQSAGRLLGSWAPLQGGQHTNTRTAAAAAAAARGTHNTGATSVHKKKKTPHSLATMAGGARSTQQGHCACWGAGAGTAGRSVGTTARQTPDRQRTRQGTRQAAHAARQTHALVDP